MERLEFAHMDAQGRLRREFVARVGAGISSMLPLAGAAMRGMSDALVVATDDGRCLCGVREKEGEGEGRGRGKGSEREGEKVK